MKTKNIVLLMSMFLLFGISTTQAIDWSTNCLNSTHVFRQTNVNVNGVDYDLNQTVSCVSGCSNNDCIKPIGNDLYMFFGALTIIFIVIALLQREQVIISWIAFILSGSMSAMTMQLKISFVPLMFLWTGLSLIMLVLAIVDTLSHSAKTIKEANRNQRIDV